MMIVELRRPRLHIETSNAAGAAALLRFFGNLAFSLKMSDSRQ